MNIRLEIHLGHQRLLAGPELATALSEADRATLKAMPYLGGIVHFEHPEQPEMILRDDLDTLIPPLCIWSRPSLAAGESVTVSLSSEAFDVTLSQREETLEVEGGWGTTAVYPFAEAIEALRACGHEFVRFLELNLADDPDWKRKIRYYNDKFEQLGELPPEDEGNHPDPYEAIMKEIEAEEAALKAEEAALKNEGSPGKA